MFGIGPQEVVVILVLVLIVFGPSKASDVSRDFGRMVNRANRSVEDLKDELLSEEVKEARRTVEEFRDEAKGSVKEFKDEARHSFEEVRKTTEVAAGEEGDEPAKSHLASDKDEEREPNERGKSPPNEEEASPAAVQTQAQKKPEERHQEGSTGFRANELEIDTRKKSYKTTNRSRWKRALGS